MLPTLCHAFATLLVQKDRKAKVEGSGDALEEIEGGELSRKLLTLRKLATSCDSQAGASNEPSARTCMAKIIWCRFHCRRSSMSSSEKRFILASAIGPGRMHAALFSPRSPRQTYTSCI